MSTPKSDEEKAKEMFRVSATLAPVIAKSLCTIIRLPDVDHGDLVGTGTFVRYGQRTYILTAGHVAKKATKYPGCAHSIGTGRRPLPITRPFLLHSSEEVDIAVLPLEGEDLIGTSVIAVDERAIAADSTDLNDLLLIQGFPQSQSRFSVMAPGLLSDSLPYVTVSASLRAPPFDPFIHFAIEYPGEGQEREDGQLATLPSPHGMSGTAVWKTGRASAGSEWTPEHASVIGVVHTWDLDSSSLVATRIEPILELLSAVENDRA